MLPSSDLGDPDLGFPLKLPKLGDKIDRNKEAPRRCLHGGYDAKSATIDWSEDLGFPLLYFARDNHPTKSSAAMASTTSEGLDDETERDDQPLRSGFWNAKIAHN
jgi:hypothetical protein